MPTLYTVSLYGKVRRIEATRITESSYFTIEEGGKEERHSRSGSASAAFETEKEAVDWMRDILIVRKREASEAVAAAQRRLDEFNAKYPQP